MEKINKVRERKKSKKETGVLLGKKNEKMKKTLEEYKTFMVDLCGWSSA